MARDIPPIPPHALQNLVERSVAISVDEFVRFGRGAGGPEHQHNFHRRAGIQRNGFLEGDTGVVSSASLAAERGGAQQSFRRFDAAAQAEDGAAVCSPAASPLGKIGKHHRLGEIGTPPVPQKQGIRGLINFTGHEMGRRGAALAHDHVGIKADLKIALAAGQIGDLQPGKFHRILRRDCRRQLHFEFQFAGLIQGKAQPMPGAERAIAAAKRLHGGRGEQPRLGVAHIEDFAGAIGDGIVRPGGNLPLAAIGEPRIAPAFGRTMRAETGIGDDIDPGAGHRALPAVQHDIFSGRRVKSAEAVEVGQTLR